MSRIVLTKIDGNGSRNWGRRTIRELDIPVKLIMVSGEKIDDIGPIPLQKTSWEASWRSLDFRVE